MSDKHIHQRDDEDIIIEHRREDDYAVPNVVKWVATFINRVGFPIFAFCIMTYFCFITLERNTKTLNELKEVLISVKASLDR